MRLLALILFTAALGCGLYFVLSTSGVGQAEQPVNPEPDCVVAEFQTGRQGRPLYVHGTVCGEAVLLLIDTNLSKSILDRSFLSQLGSLVEQIELETTGSKITVDCFAAPTIDLPPLRLQSPGSIVCCDLGGFRDAGGTDVRGVLGMDVLTGYVMMIDFDAGIVRLSRDSRAEEVSGDTPISLTFIAGIPMIEAQTADTTHRFRIDTGSTDSCIRTSEYDALVRHERLRSGAAYSVMTPSGPVSARFGILDRFALGPFEHAELPFEDGPMSLLGLPYLSRYRWTFDFPRGVAYVRRGKNFSHNDFLGTSGLALQRMDERLVIVGIKPTSDAAGIAQVGDEVTALDDESTDGMDMFRARQILTKPAGSSVDLRLRRNDGSLSCRIRTRDRLGAL